MTRDHIWYVTIDPEDNCRPDHNRHRRNITRLQAIAERAAIRVDPIWMPNLQAEMLEEEDLLAIFGSGSFSEWFAYTQNPFWAEQLDRYCELIRTMHVPMMAVCGTHQLVVRAFDGWDGVGLFGNVLAESHDSFSFTISSTNSLAWASTAETILSTRPRRTKYTASDGMATRSPPAVVIMARDTL